jgi:hypothetical protein
VFPISKIFKSTFIKYGFFNSIYLEQEEIGL